MTKKEIDEYRKINRVYYPTVPSLSERCPVNYNYRLCSSSEYGNVCRTCCHYNPLRMLYEHYKNETLLETPRDVLLLDADIQLNKKLIIHNGE